MDGLIGSRAVVDGSSVCAVFGGAQTGANPTDRSKVGSKRHPICDGHVVPLAMGVCYEKRASIHEAFLALACTVIG
jgi:hypothetical protein